MDTRAAGGWLLQHGVVGEVGVYRVDARHPQSLAVSGENGPSRADNRDGRSVFGGRIGDIVEAEHLARGEVEAQHSALADRIGIEHAVNADCDGVGRVDALLSTRLGILVRVGVDADRCRVGPIVDTRCVYPAVLGQVGDVGASRGHESRALRGLAQFGRLARIVVRTTRVD